MKLDPNRATELAERLRPFLEGRRNTCFSEVHGVLNDIMQYLEEGYTFHTTAVEDPTIRNQLPLSF